MDRHAIAVAIDYACQVISRKVVGDAVFLPEIHRELADIDMHLRPVFVETSPPGAGLYPAPSLVRYGPTADDVTAIRALIRDSALAHDYLAKKMCVGVLMGQLRSFDVRHLAYDVLMERLIPADDPGRPFETDRNTLFCGLVHTLAEVTSMTATCSKATLSKLGHFPPMSAIGIVFASMRAFIEMPKEATMLRVYAEHRDLRNAFQKWPYVFKLTNDLPPRERFEALIQQAQNDFAAKAAAVEAALLPDPAN